MIPKVGGGQERGYENSYNYYGYDRLTITVLCTLVTHPPISISDTVLLLILLFHPSRLVYYTLKHSSLLYLPVYRLSRLLSASLKNDLYCLTTLTTPLPLPSVSIYTTCTFPQRLWIRKILE